jgi:hypothetical protein
MKLLLKISLLICLTLSLVSSRHKSTRMKARDRSQLDQFLKETIHLFEKRNSLADHAADGKSIIYHESSGKDIKDQFNQDVLMTFKTLFPENATAEKFFTFQKDLTHNHASSETKNKVFAFKKILLAMFENGLYYDHQENYILNINKSEHHLWKYPLASVFCHGARVIFLFKKEIGSNEFMKYFFSEDNSFLKPRGAASHKVVFTKDKIEEQKIIFEAAANFITYSVTSSTPHFGMNIPFGGVGNFYPDGDTQILDSGYGYKVSDPLATYEMRQSGHLYVRYDGIEGSSYASLMMGLEQEEPGYRGMFSAKKHNMFSALSPGLINVCGGDKWKVFEKTLGKTSIPNNYGGKVVFFDDLPNEKLLNKISNFSENFEKKIWWILLSSNNQQFKIIKEFINQLEEKDFEDLLKAKISK